MFSIWDVQRVGFLVQGFSSPVNFSVPASFPPKKIALVPHPLPTSCLIECQYSGQKPDPAVNGKRRIDRHFNISKRSGTYCSLFCTENDVYKIVEISIEKYRCLVVLASFWLLLAPLGPLLGRSWPLLGRSWPLLARYWPLLVRSWAALGRSWPALGRSWALKNG